MPGGFFSEGYGINQAGQVTGVANTDPSGYFLHAFLSSHGQMQDLGTLPGYPNSQGNAINDVGQVAGYSYHSEDDSHAFLYSNGQWTDLGTLPGYFYSSANGLNQVGQVVGWLATTSIVSGHHAFLYSNGQMQDLNDLIDPALGLTLYEATGINDQGQIVGNSTGGVFFLTPIPEPSTLALLGAALLGLGAWVCVHRA